MLVRVCVCVGCVCVGCVALLLFDFSLTPHLHITHTSHTHQISHITHTHTSHTHITHTRTSHPHTQPPQTTSVPSPTSSTNRPHCTCPSQSFFITSHHISSTPPRTYTHTQLHIQPHLIFVHYYVMMMLMMCCVICKERIGLKWQNVCGRGSVGGCEC